MTITTTTGGRENCWKKNVCDLLARWRNQVLSLPMTQTQAGEHKRNVAGPGRQIATIQVSNMKSNGSLK